MFEPEAGSADWVSCYVKASFTHWAYLSYNGESILGQSVGRPASSNTDMINRNSSNPVQVTQRSPSTQKRSYLLTEVMLLRTCGTQDWFLQLGPPCTRRARKCCVELLDQSRIIQRAILDCLYVCNTNQLPVLPQNFPTDFNLIGSRLMEEGMRSANRKAFTVGSWTYFLP